MWCRRVVNTLLSLALIILSLQTSAQAAILSTEEMITTEAAHSPRSDPALLAHRLEALGLPARLARDRVGRLTVAERETLAARLDQLPPGGDAIGALAFVALILLLTDILGLTDVYPFVTHTVNGEKTTAKAGDCAPGETVSLQH